MNPTAALVIALLLTAALAPSASAAEIVITDAGVSPRIVDAVTGERVTFVNSTGGAVHIVLDEVTPGHEIVQAPGEPLWAVFHRQGTHPFTVHVYTPRSVTFSGAVDVTADADHAWDLESCGVRVRGECLAQ